MSANKTMFDLAGEKLSVNIVKYGSSDRTAISLTDKDGCPYMTVTSNLPDEAYNPEILDKVKSGEYFAVKNYAENSGIFEALFEAGFIEPVGLTVRGNHDTQWPIGKLVSAEGAVTH